MLRTRIISALVMGLVLLLALLFLPQPGWALFAIIVLGVAAWEWAGFARLPATSTSGETRDSRGLSRLIYALCAAMLCGVAAWWTGLFDSPGNRDRIAMIYLIGAVFWLIGVPIWLARLPPRPARPMVLAAGLFVLLPAYVAILDLRLFGVLAIILVMAIAWVADVAAYFAGHRFGRNKLAPRVSPGKTWEGAAGGLIAVGAYAMIAGSGFRALTGTRHSVLLIVIGAVLLAAISVMGDLYESALKRQAGLKDSGHILPGHGGVLDRIDALLPILPLAAWALTR